MVLYIDRYKRKKNGRLNHGSDYGILNWNSPTRVPLNGEPSSPDVSLASAFFITSCSWHTLVTLSSDHLRIFIRLQMKTASNSGLRRTYVNLKKGTTLRATIYYLGHNLSDSGYMEVIINHPYAEAWQGHLPRNFLPANLVTLPSRISPGISTLTHNQQISPPC